MNETLDENKSQPGMRISLKWMLIALVLLGAGLGLLGRMFLRHHEVFQIAVSILSTIVPFLLAIGTLIVYGRRHRSRGLILWALFILVMPVIGFGTIFLSEALLRPGPGGLGVMTTQQIIATELPQKYDEPWVWNELTARLQNGKLTGEEANAAILELAGQMKAAKPGGWDSPMHWQDKFIEAAMAAGLLSDEAVFAFCDAFYGTEPTVEPLQRLRAGLSPNIPLRVQYGSTWAEHSGLPVHLLWTVDKATIDGEPIKLRHGHHNVRSADLNTRFEHDLAAGDHKLVLEIECAYIDADKLFGLDTNNLPLDRWPQARRRWTKKIEVPFKVYGGGQQIVKLVTDPQLDPMAVRGIRVERFVIQQSEQGYSVAAKLHYGDTLPVSLSMDVVAVIDDQEVELGQSFVLLDGTGRISGNHEHFGELPGIDPETEYGDILLIPNSAHIERYPVAKEIWGKPIRFRNLKLERLDLERDAEEDAE